MNDKKQSNMESKGKNIPKLRFPGFEGEWEVKKLGDVAKNQDNKRKPVSKIERVTGEYPYYGANGIQDYVNDFIFDGEHLLIGEDGSVVNPDGTPVLNWATGKIWVNNHAHVLSESEKGNLKYIFYALSTVNIQGLVTGIPPKLNQENLNSIKIPIPTLPEQQKIASCLSSLDGQISAEQSRLESLSQHKRGLMQQLFPQEGENAPKLRFPGFEGEWEVEKIHDLFEIRNGYTPSKATPEYWENGTIPWFRMEDIRENGNILYDSMQHISKSAIKGNKLFKANSIIVATSATIGEHALIKVDSMANQRFTNLAIKENYAQLLDTMYIYHYMFIVDEICKKNTNMNAFASVDMKTFGNIPFSFPALPEQQKIASCLTAIDKLIATQQERIEALKQHKRGLMQQLFPAVANE